MRKVVGSVAAALVSLLLLTGCPNNGAPDCGKHLVAKRSRSTGEWHCYRPDQVPK